MRTWLSLVLTGWVGLAAASAVQAETFDVVVYGCTPAGLTAAIQVKTMNQSVVLLCRDDYVGGMTTNGLGWADTGNHAAIGGLARKFYQDVKTYYLAQGYTAPVKTQSAATPEDADAMWVFEPHVAEAIFNGWLKTAGINPVYRARLQLDPTAVVKSGPRITAIRMEDGRTWQGRMFIDATYEGDLMGMAGVDFATGRESNAVYGETINGIQTKNAIHHQFEHDIDPYVVPGQPDSGLLPMIEPKIPGPDGAGDHRIQAYTFRLCMTKVATNRAPFAKPNDYDPKTYELLARYFDAGWRDLFRKYDPIPNAKTDTNNYGGVSTDYIGGNYGYPLGSYAEREAIIADHVSYQQGLLWFMQNDPRAPADVRALMADWGLCADEFTANGNWPREVYVREGRRMVSDFVMTENHLRGTLVTPRSIGLGSYAMDSHNTQRYVDERGFVRNEGDVQAYLDRTYEISYDSLVPKRSQAENLIVPVAVSSSHIAFGSIRMEPVFMILGQSSGAAAVMANDTHVAVQDVDYGALKIVLVAEGQRVDPVAGKYVPSGVTQP